MKLGPYGFGKVMRNLLRGVDRSKCDPTVGRDVDGADQNPVYLLRFGCSGVHLITK